MSKIKNQIGESRAGVIMSYIATVLALEFAEQKVLGNTFLPDQIASDYIAAPGSGDVPFVGVMYSSTKTNADYQNQSDVKSQYIIECKGLNYTDSRRMSEVVRAILMNAEYRTLGLPNNFGIKGTSVLSRDMTIFDNRRSTQDNTTAYVVFEVSHYETTEKVEGIPLVLDSVTANRGDKFLFYKTDLT